MKHLYVAAELIQAAGLGEIGVDLYVNTMPSDVHKGVMLRDPLMGAELNEELDGFVIHEFQVIVRDNDPEAGWHLARSVGQALTQERLISDKVYILKMAPLSMPATYPKMDSDELETSLRMRCAFAML